MNLYEIDAEITKCIDEETGEILDIEYLEHLDMERDRKIENIGCWIKNLNAEAAALNEEKDKLGARQKAAENRASDLKKYLSGYLSGDKFKSARVAISWRKSKSVDIKDISKLPQEFLKQVDPVPDKTGIKNAIETGKEVPGAEIVVNQSIQIR